MSLDVNPPQNVFSAAKNFGRFSGEVFTHLGVLLEKPANWMGRQMTSIAGMNTWSKEVLEGIRNQKDLANKVFLATVFAVHLYCSPLFFLVGACLGLLASATNLSPLKFPSLEEGNLLGDETSRVVSVLAFCNIYLGRTLLDDIFFGGFTGLIAGNTFYHACKDSSSYKKFEEFFLRTVLGWAVNPAPAQQPNPVEPVQEQNPLEPGQEV